MTFLFNKAHAQSSLMPVAGTSYASRVDDLYGFLLIASFVSCVLVIGGFIYFCYRYKRQSDNDKTAYITHNNTLEFLWSFIPFVIFMIVFAWGWYLYDDMRSMPDDALEVHVVGQKWNWNFLYKSGRSETNEFNVPVNTPVKLIMSSRDVLHSFFIPAFRIKQDVIPGRYTTLWFEADKTGNFQIFCTEYCGAGHSDMLAKVNVMEKEEYESWLKKVPYKGLSLVEVGEQNFTNKCSACHMKTPGKKIGPSFAGLWGRMEELVGGKEVQVDEEYLRESILNPNEKIVAGYPAGVMPTYQGQLSPKEVSGLVEYIKTLK